MVHMRNTYRGPAVYDLCYILLVGCLCWVYYSLGVSCAKEATIQKEQTSLCYDTKKVEAWVATKGGFKRCFMEQRSYPHRVRASHIEGNE